MDSGREWYYVPLAGSYLYLGALAHVAGKLMELNEAGAKPHLTVLDAEEE